MMLYFLSLIPLIAGPLVVRLLGVLPGAERFLDGFVVVSVGGLVLLHILPLAVSDGGSMALAGAAVGLVLPFLAGGLLHGKGALRRGLVMSAALVGLCLHALVDGMALSGHGLAAHGGELLAAAVVLHRLPVGIAIWRVVRPRYGPGAALWVLAIIIGATSVGTFGAGVARPLLTGPPLAIFQAFVAGALLHVLLSHGQDEGCSCKEERWPLTQLLGALIAGAGVLGASLLDLDHHAGQGMGPLAMSVALAGLAAFVMVRPRLAGIVPWVEASRGGEEEDCHCQYHYVEHPDHSCEHHHMDHPECGCGEDDSGSRTE